MDHLLQERARARLERETAHVRPAADARLRIALAYPNTYSVGMSNLGMHTLYRLLNALPGVRCERVFLPDPVDLERHKQTGTSLFALESLDPVSSFDLLAFSASFENDYRNLVEMLDLAGIARRAEQRTHHDPLVLMGGAAVSINPEPVAPFLDIGCVGEGEELVAPLVDACFAATSREDLLDRLAQAPGFYVPARYDPVYELGTDGVIPRFSGLAVAQNAPDVVTKVRASLDRPSRVAATAIHTPDTEFGDRVTVEVARGCTKGCRYCWVGYSILPFRVHTAEDVLAAVRPWRDRVDRVGLVATALLDHPGIEDIATQLRADGFKVFSPSLIISTLRESLLEAVIDSGQETVTIAPEAGSDRMRQVVMKKITNEEILDKVRMIFRAGAVNVKNYIIIGLPGETQEDLEAIVDLGRAMREIMIEEGRERGRIGTVTMSVNCLIPKPGTPFQWAEQLTPREYRRRLRWLKRQAADIPNLVIDGMPPRTAEVQAVLSRGDRRVADLLERWVDAGDWSAALRDWVNSGGVPLAEFLRERDPMEPSPWGHLRVGPGQPALTNQWERASVIAADQPNAQASV
ncbi:MAG: radical SAM protein [Acidobacteria bacterium]|nr:radical SAM protein [Acidobacteriota bacterium]